MREKFSDWTADSINIQLISLFVGTPILLSVRKESIKTPLSGLEKCRQSRIGNISEDREDSLHLKADLQEWSTIDKSIKTGIAARATGGLGNCPAEGGSKIQS